MHCPVSTIQDGQFITEIEFFVVGTYIHTYIHIYMYMYICKYWMCCIIFNALKTKLKYTAMIRFGVPVLHSHVSDMGTIFQSAADSYTLLNKTVQPYNGNY